MPSGYLASWGSVMMKLPRSDLRLHHGINAKDSVLMTTSSNARPMSLYTIDPPERPWNSSAGDWEGRDQADMSEANLANIRRQADRLRGVVSEQRNIRLNQIEFQSYNPVNPGFGSMDVEQAVNVANNRYRHRRRQAEARIQQATPHINITGTPPHSVDMVGTWRNVHFPSSNEAATNAANEYVELA